jgi:hypothetical protein
MSKTLASFLADRPQEELQHMLTGIQQKREKIKEEDRNLAFEERLVEQALARKSRRTGSPGGGRITRDQVFEMVSENVGRRFKAPDAKAVVNSHGIEVAPESLRQHLRRLVKDGKFGRDGDFYVNPRAPEEPPVATNGAGQTTQAFPNPVVAGAGEDREIGTSSGSPYGTE